MLTVEQERALEAILRDDVGFISNFMEITDKERRRVKFVPWPVQRGLLSSLTGRDLVIKDSQIGSTSIITAKWAKDTITTPGTTSVIVAHEEFLTQRLLHRTQTFIDSVPRQLRPRQDHSSSYEKSFPEIDSVIYIGTARAQVFGRGEPIHRLLFSEEAHYVAGAKERIVQPSIERVPETGMVVRESTPNGEDESFYMEVQKVLRGESVYKLHILYWWMNPSNRLSSDSPLLRGETFEDLRGELAYEPEEEALVRAHGLTQNQIRWRRYKIKDMGALFWQEHMESLDTCFLTSGQPYYDPEVTVALSRGCYSAPYSGPAKSQVWFRPDDGGVYVMGVDPGQGKVTESVAQVWRVDLDRPREEAVLAGWYEPDIMAPKCEELARWYNNALIVPEANAHGLGLIARLRHYPRMYFRRDIVSGKARMEMGWQTTPRTKPVMMQELQRRLPHLETYDSEFIRQVRAFRELPDGKVACSTFDDYHDAGCLAFVGMLGRDPRRRRGAKGSTGWTW